MNENMCSLGCSLKQCENKLYKSCTFIYEINDGKYYIGRGTFTECKDEEGIKLFEKYKEKLQEAKEKIGIDRFYEKHEAKSKEYQKLVECFSELSNACEKNGAIKFIGDKYHLAQVIADLDENGKEKLRQQVRDFCWSGYYQTLWEIEQLNV